MQTKHKENQKTDTNRKLGCGLAYLVPKIKEHYANENKRYNQLPTRLIGDQAISLARYGYRLVDGLDHDESTEQHLRTLALGRLVLYLRHACILFSKVSATKADLIELKNCCELYFNLYCLFFPSYVNVTVWTIGYAIPYHALKLHEKYGVGYGIISLQAKESKHSGVKSDLSLSNRSNATDERGKWWQVMRANYVRSFYLPEYHPMPSSYSSHFKSRVPPHCVLHGYCICGRKKEDKESESCPKCDESIIVIPCAEKRELSVEVQNALKQYSCRKCGKRFSDEASMETHMDIHKTKAQLNSIKKNPKGMNVKELKAELNARNLSTTGNKDVLVRRLEGVIADEL